MVDHEHVHLYKSFSTRPLTYTLLYIRLLNYGTKHFTRPSATVAHERYPGFRGVPRGTWRRGLTSKLQCKVSLRRTYLNLKTLLARPFKAKPKTVNPIPRGTLLGLLGLQTVL